MQHNLKTIREARGLNRKQLAKIAGITASTITLIEAGKRWFSQDSLAKIAAALNCKEEDLLTEKKPHEDLLKALSGESLSPFNNLVLVKKYDVFASAGDGMEVLSEEVEGEIAFEKNFLKKISGTNPDQLVFIGVRGDSMYPTFKDNDVILIDKNRREIAAGGVFVIRMGNVLKVKRIFFNSFQKKLKIVSDNKVEINGERLYPDYEISTDDVANLDIVGKVIWAAWSLK